MYGYDYDMLHDAIKIFGLACGAIDCIGPKLDVRISFMGTEYQPDSFGITI